MMKTILLLLAASLMFSGVHGASQSMSCSTVNGKTICDKQSSSGNTAMSSAESATGYGPTDYQRTSAATGDTRSGSFSGSQTQTGVPPSGLVFNPFGPGAFNFDYSSYPSRPAEYDYDVYSSGSRGYDYGTYSPRPSLDYDYGSLPSSARANNDYGTYSPRPSLDYDYGSLPSSPKANDYGTYSPGTRDYDYASVSSQDYVYGDYPVAAGAFGIATAGSYPFSSIPGFGYPPQGYAVQTGTGYAGQAPPGGFPMPGFIDPFAFANGAGAAAGAGAFPFFFGRR